MDYSSLKNIPDYDHKKEDLLDVYNYLLDNTTFYDSSDDFEFDDFEFEFKECSIDIISKEINKIKLSYMEIESDVNRIKKIEKFLSLDYPVYVYDGEIIAGVHRSIAYLNKSIEIIPIVFIKKI